MARVRKLDANGDYSFGQGSINFWINSALGVAQNVGTRLGLWQSEWFLDRTVGTPWAQKVLGYGTASLRDVAIKTVILQTENVTELVSYSSVANPATRKFTVSGTILTTFSPDPVPFGPVIL
jgi:hypothetical protein